MNIDIENAVKAAAFVAQRDEHISLVCARETARDYERTKNPIDLFLAEREATNVALTLREEMLATPQFSDGRHRAMLREAAAWAAVWAVRACEPGSAPVWQNRFCKAAWTQEGALESALVHAANAAAWGAGAYDDEAYVWSRAQWAAYEAFRAGAIG